MKTNSRSKIQVKKRDGRVALLTEISKLVRWLLIASVIATGAAWFKKGELPFAKDLSRELLKAPVQTDTTRPPFAFDYRGDSYLVKPVADYELKGLVVTHNDITAFGDIYHDENSVDIKDLCVIWGSNIIDDNFRKMKYHSESVSCHFQSTDNASYESFNPEQLSNNHLIASNESIRDKIRSVRVGDQISLRGMLVNYSQASRPGGVRNSSTTRKDTGGGACEVVFADEFNIIKKAPRTWFTAYEMGLRLCIFLLILRVGLGVLVPWLDLKLNT